MSAHIFGLVGFGRPQRLILRSLVLRRVRDVRIYDPSLASLLKEEGLSVLVSDDRALGPIENVRDDGPGKLKIGNTRVSFYWDEFDITQFSGVTVIFHELMQASPSASSQASPQSSLSYVSHETLFEHLPSLRHIVDSRMPAFMSAGAVFVAGVFPLEQHLRTSIKADLVFISLASAFWCLESYNLKQGLITSTFFSVKDRWTGPGFQTAVTTDVTYVECISRMFPRMGLTEKLRMIILSQEPHDSVKIDLTLEFSQAVNKTDVLSTFRKCGLFEVKPFCQISTEAMALERNRKPIVEEESVKRISGNCISMSIWSDVVQESGAAVDIFF